MRKVSFQIQFGRGRKPRINLWLERNNFTRRVLHDDFVPPVAVKVNDDRYGDKSARLAQVTLTDDFALRVNRQHLRRREVAHAHFACAGKDEVQTMTALRELPFALETSIGRQ